MSVLHCVRREDNLIFYAGGTLQSPKNRLVTISIHGGMEALPDGALLDVTPRQCLAIAEALAQHREAYARDLVAAAMVELELAMDSMKGLTVSESDYKKFAACLDASKKKFRALVKREPGEPEPTAAPPGQALSDHF